MRSALLLLPVISGHRGRGFEDALVESVSNEERGVVSLGHVGEMSTVGGNRNLAVPDGCSLIERREAGPDFALPCFQVEIVNLGASAGRMRNEYVIGIIVKVIILSPGLIPEISREASASMDCNQ